MNVEENVNIIVGNKLGPIIFDKIKKDCGDISEKNFIKWSTTPAII